MRTVVSCVAFCLLQLLASVEPLPGSCIAAKYTTCCEGSPTSCPGEPPTCLCDTSCYEFDDCCSDIDQICPPRLPPPPKPLLLPPTHITLHSTIIQWIRTPTNTSMNETYTYIVHYYTNGTNSTTQNVTDFLGTGEVLSCLLHGLDPATTYVYSVSIFDMVGSSTRSEESLFTTMEHPVVGHVQTKVLNSTAVGVSWSPLHLPPGVTVSLYTVQYRNSGSTKETQIFSGTETCGEIGGLTPQTEYSFRVVNLTLHSPFNWSLVARPCQAFRLLQYKHADSALFQLRGGPLQDCVDWNADDERELLGFFRSETVGAITSQCGCTYQDSLLTRDIILCEAGSPPQATFRAALMSTKTCTTGRLLQCLQNWVSHGSTVQGPSHISFTFDTSCPVNVRLSSDPLCSLQLNPVPDKSSAQRAETCISVPVYVTTLVAVFLLVAAFIMAVIVVAMLVASKRHKKVTSEPTGESLRQQEAVSNVYHEPAPPSDDNPPTE